MLTWTLGLTAHFPVDVAIAAALGAFAWTISKV